MKIPKPTDDDRAFFATVVPDDPGVTVKPMFGNVAAFVNGNMFMGLFGSALGLRLPDDQREELLAIDGAGPFGPQERPMGGYAAPPESWRDQLELVDDWITRALEHTASMPAKKPKKKATKKTAAKKTSR